MQITACQTCCEVWQQSFSKLWVIWDIQYRWDILYRWDIQYRRDIQYRWDIQYKWDPFHKVKIKKINKI